jgi:MYXO-CTERM domain-containing protein
MTHRFVPTLGSLISLAALCLPSRSAVAQEACFERIDNGVDLKGWQPSTTNPHGPGEGWTVVDGALVGGQTEGQQGGILMTEATYQDVEVIFEVRIDWECDSGFFFRTTEGNRAYQVTIDHMSDSSVGTLWGESFPEQLRAIPYWLTDNGSTAIVAPDRTEEPIFDLGLWPSIWNPTDFNEIRARVEGNPPHIQVWISDTQVTDFTDSVLRSDVNESGPLAIQVHGGDRWVQDGTVAFRNIRVRDLTVPCEQPGTGGAGGSGAGGTTTGVGDVGVGGIQSAGGNGAEGITSTGSAMGSGGAAQPGMDTVTSAAGSIGGSGVVATGGSGVDAMSSTTSDSSAATSGAPPARAEESGGCGCRMGPQAAGTVGTPLLFVALATLTRRRHRGLARRAVNA